MGANVSCCTGSTINFSDILRGITCICLRKNKKNLHTPKFNKTIIFNKLPTDIDFGLVFDHNNISDSINIIFNNQGYIISAHSNNVSKIFGTKTDNLIGYNVYTDLVEFAPASIIGMIVEILEYVQKTSKVTGCMIRISDKYETGEYIMVGFPIFNNNSTEIIGTLLVKQPFTYLLTHKSILSSVEYSDILLSQSDYVVQYNVQHSNAHRSNTQHSNAHRSNTQHSNTHRSHTQHSNTHRSHTQYDTKNEIKHNTESNIKNDIKTDIKTDIKNDIKTDTESDTKNETGSDNNNF